MIKGNDGFQNSQDGVFMMTSREFESYFADIQFAMKLDNYESYWYDKEGDD